jgi:LPXTG-motif cell wall-anchored protein
MLITLLPIAGLMLLALVAGWWLRRRRRDIDDADEDQPFQPPLVTWPPPN